MKLYKDWREFLKESEEDLVQDVIGGMVRPDQIEKNIIDDLKSALILAREGNFEFLGMINIIQRRVELLKKINLEKGGL